MKTPEIKKKFKFHYNGKNNIPKKIDCWVPVSPGDTMETASRKVLKELSDTLQLPVDEKSLQIVQSKSTSLGNYVRFQQYINGIPVESGEIIVHIDKAGFVRQIVTNHQSASKVLAPSKAKIISAEDAKKIMTEAVGEKFTIRPNGKFSVEKTYFQTEEGLRMSWLVVATTLQPPHDWFVYVDAENGNVLALEDRIMYIDGSGMVYEPNPVVLLNDNSIREGTTSEAILDGVMGTRNLREITGPIGGQYSLSGPFCSIVNLGNPNIGIPQEAIATNFNYNRTQDNFEAVNAYYHIDSLQRYIQNTLGIFDANNRAINADPHDNSINAAWYSSVTKDLHFSDSGPGIPDRAEDSDCIVHEYGHAIQDDMVPGWGSPVAGTTRYESRAIGEGFCDILAVLYNILYGNGYQRQVFEDWIFVSNNLGDGLRGLRRVDHNKLYSAFVSGGSMNLFYPNSEIWSGALWNIFLTMGGDSAMVADWEEPRDILLKALIASHNALTTRTSMPEAAEELMKTHERLEDQCGRHLVAMVDEFHDREIIECQPGSDIRLLDLWTQQDNSSTRSWENVEYGQDNWFYANITNQGTVAARSLVVNFSFKSPFTTPVYPADFRTHVISAVVEFNLAAGETRTIWGRWDKDLIPAIPAGQTQLHGCILAEIYNPADKIAAGVIHIGASNGKLRQRNTNIIDLLPDESADFQFTISNFYLQHEEPIRLEVIRPEKWPNLQVTFSHHDMHIVGQLLQQARELSLKQYVKEELSAYQPPALRFLQSTRVELAGASGGEQIIFDLAPDSSMMLKKQVSLYKRNIPDAEFFRCDALELIGKENNLMTLRPGIRTGFPFMMKPRQRLTLNVSIKVPKEANPGEEFTVVFVQQNKQGEYIGGFDLQVNVVEKKKIPRAKAPLSMEKLGVKIKRKKIADLKKTTASE